MQSKRDFINSIKDAINREKTINLIIDCNVFSSEYFPGGTFPFPFSFPVRTLLQILDILREQKINIIAMHNFNPNIEYFHSSKFLIQILERLVSGQ